MSGRGARLRLPRLPVQRTARAIGTARCLLRQGLAPVRDFPPPERALGWPTGLLAVGGPLTPERVLEAYRRGIYPYYRHPPVKWWSPDPRMVLLPGRLHVQRSLRGRLRRGHFRVSFDRDFEAVVEGCADRRSTWIRPELRAVLAELHRDGVAHSVEVHDASGALAGGGYGLALGGAFFSESLFTRASDASKVGFVVLSRHLEHWGFALNDLQQTAPHLARWGGEPLPRARFLALLAEALARPGRPGPWEVDPDLDPVDGTARARP